MVADEKSKCFSDYRTVIPHRNNYCSNDNRQLSPCSTSSLAPLHWVPTWNKIVASVLKINTPTVLFPIPITSGAQPGFDTCCRSGMVRRHRTIWTMVIFWDVICNHTRYGRRVVALVGSLCRIYRNRFRYVVFALGQLSPAGIGPII